VFLAAAHILVGSATLLGSLEIIAMETEDTRVCLCLLRYINIKLRQSHQNLETHMLVTICNPKVILESLFIST